MLVQTVKRETTHWEEIIYSILLKGWESRILQQQIPKSKAIQTVIANKKPNREMGKDTNRQNTWANPNGL